MATKLRPVDFYLMALDHQTTNPAVDISFAGADMKRNIVTYITNIATRPQPIIGTPEGFAKVSAGLEFSNNGVKVVEIIEPVHVEGLQQAPAPYTGFKAGPLPEKIAALRPVGTSPNLLDRLLRAVGKDTDAPQSALQALEHLDKIYQRMGLVGDTDTYKGLKVSSANQHWSAGHYPRLNDLTKVLKELKEEHPDLNYKLRVNEGQYVFVTNIAGNSIQNSRDIPNTIGIYAPFNTGKIFVGEVDKEVLGTPNFRPLASSTRAATDWPAAPILGRLTGVSAKAGAIDETKIKERLEGLIKRNGFVEGGIVNLLADSPKGIRITQKPAPAYA